MPSLEICIPTYNRPEALVKNLKRLLSFQENSNFSILVVDNCSDFRLPDEFITGDDAKGYRYIRNLCNVGGQANILKCFEHGVADYLWIIGDDDFLEFDGIDNVVKTISEKDYIDVFGFRCVAPGHQPRKEFYEGNSRERFIECAGSLASLFYSVGYVFKRTSMLKFLKNAYINLNFFGPHVALYMHSSNLKYCSLDLPVHKWEKITENENCISPLPLLLNMPLLLDSANNNAERIILKKYLKNAKKDFISPLKLVLIIIRSDSVWGRQTIRTVLSKYIRNSEFRIPTFSGFALVGWLIAYAIAPKPIHSISNIVLNWVMGENVLPCYSNSDERI